MIIGMRDFVRNSNILDGYDYVDVEDKKTHEYKGLFISPKYAEDFKKFLDDKIAKQKRDKLNRILQFSGIADDDTKNMSSKEMRALHGAKYS